MGNTIILPFIERKCDSEWYNLPKVLFKEVLEFFGVKEQICLKKLSATLKCTIDKIIDMPFNFINIHKNMVIVNRHLTFDSLLHYTYTLQSRKVVIYSKNVEVASFQFPDHLGVPLQILCDSKNRLYIRTREELYLLNNLTFIWELWFAQTVPTAELVDATFHPTECLFAVSERTTNVNSATTGGQSQMIAIYEFSFVNSNIYSRPKTSILLWTKNPAFLSWDQDYLFIQDGFKVYRINAKGELYYWEYNNHNLDFQLTNRLHFPFLKYSSYLNSLLYYDIKKKCLCIVKSQEKGRVIRFELAKNCEISSFLLYRNGKIIILFGMKTESGYSSSIHKMYEFCKKNRKKKKLDIE